VQKKAQIFSVLAPEVCLALIEKKNKKKNIYLWQPVGSIHAVLRTWLFLSQIH